VPHFAQFAPDWVQSADVFNSTAMVLLMARKHTGIHTLTAVVRVGYYLQNSGTLCRAGVMTKLDEVNQEFYQEMDYLNAFMRTRNLPQMLKIKLRDYVHFTWNGRRADGGGDVAMLLAKLSDSLALQVYHHTHVPALRSLHVFQGTSDDFLGSLCGRLKTRMFSPEDMVIK
jgi:hypothetical protein